MSTAFVLGSGISNYITAVRTDIGDDDNTSYTYTDAQLIELVKKSMREINLLIDKSYRYYPASSGIAPTPGESEGALIIANVECLIARRARSSAVRKGIRVRDGDSEIDTTAAFAGYKDVASDACGRFKELLVQYMNKKNGVEDYGDTVWHESYPQYVDEDHDGTADHTRYYDSPFDP